MEKRRYSQISDSEESNSSSSRSEAPVSKTVKKKIAGSDSSDSCSDSESGRLEPTSTRSPSSIKETGTSSQLQKFARNQHLTQLRVHDEITDEDDICMLEVPKTFDATSLQGKVVNFHRKTKIKVNNNKYTIERSGEDTKPINLLSKTLKVIHPLSYLKLLDNTKIKRNSEALETENFISSLPNIKVRHPLFGPDYEEKIVLYERTERNKDAPKKMRKKKKRESEMSQESPTDVQLDQPKKKKRTKRKDDNGTANVAVKTERRNEKHDSGEVEESIFALLESHILEKSKESRKNNIKEELIEPLLNLSDFEESLEHHRVETKTKRHKNRVKEEAHSSQEYEPSLNDSNGNSKSEKKRKQKNSIKQEKIDIGDMELFFNESINKSTHQKNNIKKEAMVGESMNEKKKKRNNSMVEEQFNSTHSNPAIKEDSINDVSYMDESKRKRKKSIREEYKNLADDSLSLREGTEETHKKQKSKRKSSVKKEASDIETNQSYGQVSFNENIERNKNKKNSIANSTVIPDLQLPLFEFDVSRITNQDDPTSVDESVRTEKFDHQSNEDLEPQQKKKKKRVKEESFESSANHSEDTGFEDNEDDHHSFIIKKTKKERENENDQSSTKKRRKNVDQSDDKNALILSLLSKVKSEINNSS